MKHLPPLINDWFEQLRSALRCQDRNVESFKTKLGVDDTERRKNALKPFVNPKMRPRCSRDRGDPDVRLLGRTVTIFEMVALYNRCDILEYLLSIDIDVNHKNDDGFSALEICVAHPLSTNSTPFSTQDYKHTFDLCCIRLLLSRPNIIANTKVLQFAADKDEKYEILTLLLKHVNVTNKTRWDTKCPEGVFDINAVYLTAVRHEQAHNMRILLQQYSVYVNACNINDGNTLTTMHYNGTDDFEESLTSVRQVLNYLNIDVNRMNKNGVTALQMADKSNAYFVVALLTHGII
jgi:hypothetical protein